jgi:dephospho-CoA kinase
MPKVQKIIGLTGLAGCGKGTAAEYLHRKYGLEWFVLSDILKAEAERRGLLKGKSMEESKFILSKFGDQWRKETGMKSILGIKMIELLKERGVEKAIVDGFRSVEEVEMFRKVFNFTLVFVDTSLETRWKRRHKQDPKSNRADFEARDRNDIEKLGLGNVIKSADFRIDNNGTKEELGKQLDDLMRKMG